MWAIIEALKNDVLDVIEIDHAPHSAKEKEQSMATAPFGIVGLETAYAITNTELVRTGILSKKQLVEKMSLNPAKILDRVCIGEGYVADMVIVDPDMGIQLIKMNFQKLATPLHGQGIW